MRMALLSDIHGNLIALDAVLTDIEERGGVNSYWILGDLVAQGPDPVGVLERLAVLPNAHFIRGNTDRYVVSSDRPLPALADVLADLRLLPVALEIAGTFGWTQGAITSAGWLAWLQALPLEIRFVLPDGTHLLAVHAEPGRDDGDGIGPEMPDSLIQAKLQECDTSVVCVGHTHQPMNRHIAQWHVINLGSISLSLTPNRWASYGVITATQNDYSFNHYCIDYDRAAVVKALDAVGHPGGAYICRHLDE